MRRRRLPLLRPWRPGVLEILHHLLSGTHGNRELIEEGRTMHPKRAGCADLRRLWGSCLRPGRKRMQLSERLSTINAQRL
jgi:hypothetical protein